MSSKNLAKFTADLFQFNLSEVKFRYRSGLFVALGLIELNALAAGAVSRSLVEFSAMRANPNGGNGEGKTVFAIAKVCIHFFF